MGEGGWTARWAARRGCILEDYLPKDQTLSSIVYSELFVKKLKPKIRSKRRGLLNKSVYLQHDDARPHVENLTIETINKLNFKVLIHPPYSPDLAPSDFYVYGHFKRFLRSMTFKTGDEARSYTTHKAVPLGKYTKVESGTVKRPSYDPIWNDANCNAYNGSDGTVFPPHLTKEDDVYVFSQDVCRYCTIT
ncbi:hypothetical protein LAZ67_10000088 [Cordylochernes scorpioides]|uniref:Histone-lysine N-methyltransferase SETMAR n=1 Tax=Cordylochernes scorpioides TaxID=51811 RepID=A0ABY6KWG7_9ARAC|nr:hypothetical protein LAZ67_10000088 [Cordylochernes scorpioides]